jgi:hypothetical protein
MSSRVEATSVGWWALRAAGRATVFASFERSCYVETSDGIACLGAGIGDGPLNIVIENFKPAAAGEAVEIHVGSAKLWRPPVPDASQRPPAGKIPPAIEKPAAAFLAWIAGTGEPDDALIGLGPGLTPAGDDFVGGAMIALRAYGRADAADRIAAWALPLASVRTNRISRAHLECAAEGEGHAALHDYLCNFAKEHLQRLARIGHTSGLDAAAGALLALAVCLQGCSLPNPVKMEHLDDIPAEVVPRLDAMRELRGDKSNAFETLGAVEGVSCKRTFYKGMPASWEDAVRRAKYRALQLGADAITDLDCSRPQGSSLTTMCYESIRCTASAVRTQR